MKKSAAIIAGVVLSAAASVQAATILDTKFNNAPDASYNDKDIINAGQPAYEQLTVMRTSTSSSIKTEGNALKFIDNDSVNTSTESGPTAAKAITGVGKSAGLDSILTIKFDILSQVATSAGRPTFQLLLNDSRSTAPSAASSAIQFSVSSGGKFGYYNGTGYSEESSLLQNTDYSVVIEADFNAHTWKLKVTHGESVDIDKTFAFRAAIDTPSNIYFTGGSNASKVLATPFIELDDMSIISSSPVPEPAALSMLSLGGIALLLRKSTR